MSSVRYSSNCVRAEQRPDASERRKSFGDRMFAIGVAASKAFEKPRFWTHTILPLAIGGTILATVLSPSEATSPRDGHKCYTFTVSGNNDLQSDLSHKFGSGPDARDEIQDATNKYWLSQNPESADVTRIVNACDYGNFILIENIKQQ